MEWLSNLIKLLVENVFGLAPGKGAGGKLAFLYI
jgi:hypothetical protein